MHVGLLCGDPGESFKARQTAMLDDEVQIGEVRGDMIDVGDIEGDTVQRPDRRALVDVNVADAEFLARFEIAVRPRVVELPAA